VIKSSIMEKDALFLQKNLFARFVHFLFCPILIWI
jgi:hypothetical protein